MTAAGVNRARLAVAIVLAAAACLQGFGPARAAQDPPQQPSFRTTTTLVEVDVIVRDKQRQFVEGLTADDFEVVEEGTPQRIQTLYVVEGARVQPVPVAAGSAPAVTAAPMPPTPGPPSAQRVFVLMFDQAHLDQNSFKRLQPAAEQFLRTDFQAGDVGGVLMGTTMVGNKLTPDRDMLLAAVQSAKLSQESTSLQRDLRDWPRMSQVEAIRIALANDSRILDQVTDRANREASDNPRSQFDAEGLVRQKATQAATQLQASAAQTLKALYALVTGLGRVPGRKTVILMTEGFMFEESWGALRQIVAQAARSDVRIYTLDALGLRRGDTGTDLSQMNPLETGGQVPTAAYNTVEEGPNTLAVDTGGYVIRHTNDFTGALAEVSRDTSSYYVIGYSPTNARMDGTFRQISVRVKRPDVEVRARKGYLAVPVAAPAGRGAAPAAAPTTPPAPPVAPPAAPTATPVVDPATGPAGLATAPVIMRPDTATRVRDLETMRPDAGAGKDAASQGWDRYRKGDLEGAERLLGEAAARKEAAPWVHYALGFTKFGLSKPQEAVVSWERVRASAPEFTEVYLDLADAYIMVDDPGRAVSVLRDAERRWPANAEVLNALGTVQVRRGALNDAIDTFGRAVDRQPRDSLAYFNLGRTHELRYYQMRRFSRPGARWADNPEELRKAGEVPRGLPEDGRTVRDRRARGPRTRSLEIAGTPGYFSCSSALRAAGASGASGESSRNFVRSALVPSLSPFRRRTSAR